MNEYEEEPSLKRWILFALIIVALIVGFLMFVTPLLQPWWASQEGKAELAQAEQNRQIQIINAQAANLAATSQAETRVKIATADAQAEIERAKGVAEANRIIASGLKGNEEYLRYLWIQSLHENNVIYVPTEANLPILEARDK